MPRSRTALLSTLLLAACAPAATRSPAKDPAAGIRDPQSLVAAMHGRYAGEWYSHLAFTQRTTRSSGGAEWEETWHGFLAAPGALRLETDPGRADGLVYDRDSLFVIAHHEVTEAREQPNPLLILGMGIYTQEVPEALSDLRRAGFLPGTLRTEMWRGEPAYVVSATDAAGAKREFWVEARRLVPVRFVHPLAGRTIDVRLDDYRPVRRAWLARRVEVRVDGSITQVGEITEVRPLLPLPAFAFDPGKWDRPFDRTGFSRAPKFEPGDRPGRRGSFTFSSDIVSRYQRDPRAVY